MAFNNEERGGKEGEDIEQPSLSIHLISTNQESLPCLTHLETCSGEGVLAVNCTLGRILQNVFEVS